MNNNISLFAQTDTGKVRSNNEDNFFVANHTSEKLKILPQILDIDSKENVIFFMVSDGMGGAFAGEEASILSVTSVQKIVKSHPPKNPHELTSILTNSLQKANSLIFSRSQEDSNCVGMGATATVAGIISNRLYIGQIGDSRAYLVRGNKIVQLTEDQSYVNKLVKEGVITPHEAGCHPKKNIILQAVGSQPFSLKVAISSIDLCQDDYIILCSDGLSGLLQDNEIKDIVLNTPFINSSCNRLIERANELGGNDNITVVLAHIKNSSYPFAKEGITPTVKCVVDFFAEEI